MQRVLARTLGVLAIGAAGVVGAVHMAGGTPVTAAGGGHEPCMVYIDSKGGGSDYTTQPEEECPPPDCEHSIGYMGDDGTPHTWKPPTCNTIPETTKPTRTTVVNTNPQGGTLQICHYIGGPNEISTEITIPVADLPMHLAHGDLYPVPPGGCPNPPPERTTTTHGSGGGSSSTSTTSTTIHGGGGGTTTTTTGGGGGTTTTTSGGGGTTTTSTTLAPPPPGGGSTTTTTIPRGGIPPGNTGPTTPLITGPATPEIFIRDATSECQTGVPFIRIDFGNLTQFNGVTGTLTMSDVNGNVLSVQPLTYQANTTVFVLYPGTVVVNGEATVVPGWVINEDGFWVPDPTNAVLRQGINLTYEVNPTATAFVTYPPESSGCATPEGPFPPGPVQPPRTPSTPGGLPVTE